VNYKVIYRKNQAGKIFHFGMRPIRIGYYCCKNNVKSNDLSINCEYSRLLSVIENDEKTK